MYLQASTDTDELLMWDVSSKQRIVDISLLRDVEWVSFTCHVGWPVLGVHPPDNGKVAAVDRAKQANILAVATGRGHVMLYQYPCDSDEVLLFISVKSETILE